MRISISGRAPGGGQQVGAVAPRKAVHAAVGAEGQPGEIVLQHNFAGVGRAAVCSSAATPDADSENHKAIRAVHAGQWRRMADLRETTGGKLSLRQEGEKFYRNDRMRSVKIIFLIGRLRCFPLAHRHDTLTPCALDMRWGWGKIIAIVNFPSSVSHQDQRASHASPNKSRPHSAPPGVSFSGPQEP